MLAPWSEAEVATVDLGDERLNARMGILLSSLGSRPNLSIPAACKGRAEMEAAYRFFDNDKVTFDKVLQPHIDQTMQRMAQQQVALLVQDTSEIDVTRPKQEMVGAGTLDGVRSGFLLHEMQAFTTEGVPLGTVWAEIINRTEEVTPPSARQRQDHRTRPIEEKESLRWLTGMRRARDIAQDLPGVQCVCVADSEADIYEVFSESRGQQPVHWLIRACQDRALQDQAKGQLLRNQVTASAARYQFDLVIRGREAKTTVETRGRRQNRAQRQAHVEVRAATVTLRPPWRRDRELPPVTLNVVLVSEPNPPPDEEPVEWILVTTLPIDTLEQVQTVVAYYCVRWRIEMRHPHYPSSQRLYCRVRAA
jgi:Transposase DNA-binding/Transposase DDE domain